MGLDRDRSHPPLPNDRSSPKSGREFNALRRELCLDAREPMEYLTMHPVNRLKIAQELVFGVTTDSRNATVVRAAIHLGQELGIEVIAEGVETEAQANFLLTAGCAFAQGYYFSRPVNAERATELLRARKIEVSRMQTPRLDVTAA